MCTHTYMGMHTHTYMGMHTHTYMGMHTHTHIYLSKNCHVDPGQGYPLDFPSIPLTGSTANISTSRSGVIYRALSTIRIVLTCNLDRIHTLAFQKEICGSTFAYQVSEFYYFTRISEPLNICSPFTHSLKF